MRRAFQWLFILAVNFLPAQVESIKTSSIPGKIIFKTDTISITNPGIIIPNWPDSIVLYFDAGFAGDTVKLLINGIIKYEMVLTSEPSLDLAGMLTIPKIKRAVIVLQVNRRRYEGFEWKGRYPVAHINYADKSLSLTYCNRVYEYD